MMMVSIVMPEAGLLAVVAMALAATEVKKNENSSVSTRPNADHRPGDLKVPRRRATPIAPMTTPSKMETIGISRSVRSGCGASP